MRVPRNLLLRTDNPEATITSRSTGFPAGARHTLDRHTMLLAALKLSHYQTAAEAFADIPQHREVFLGDKHHVRVRVDRFGNPGIVTLPEYTVRRPGTIRALLPARAFPRPMAAEPCHLTDAHISANVLSAIEQGVPFSYSIVRPRFGNNRTGDILIFWPSHAPFYGAAACDKLGECVDPGSFTADAPFDPKVIHVGIPWLSEQEFDGTYQILIGVGRKRLLVVNCGWYDGGVKKPVTFQRSDSALPDNSPYTTQHWAYTQGRNGKVFSIGNTTAAGKTEGSTNEMTLERPGVLAWRFGENLVLAGVGPDSLLMTPESSRRTDRAIFSDDISAVTTFPDGTPCGVEIEPSHYNRIDLATRPGAVPLADACAEGKIPGRIHWMGVDFDESTRCHIPWRHITLDAKCRCTNPRVTYFTASNPAVISTTPDRPVQLDYLIIAVPVPDMPQGWHMPTFIRLSLWDFFVNYCHGARANKGNPALGALGGGHWAFEGFGGKAGFTLDAEAAMVNRDMRFWRAIRSDMPCFLVFNGFSMGGQQEFKYSGTFLLRALLENWSAQLLAAPLLKLPGVYTGGVPDLRTFLPPGALDERVWNPETLSPQHLARDCGMVDMFCYAALNRIRGQRGLSEEDDRFLADLQRRFCSARAAGLRGD